jgi:hypothetical protein
MTGTGGAKKKGIDKPLIFLAHKYGRFSFKGVGGGRWATRNGTAAFAPTPVLPEATPVGPLSAQLRRPRPWSATSDILAAFSGLDVVAFRLT